LLAKLTKNILRRVNFTNFDTPCDTPADSLNPYAVDAIDDNDVFDFGEFDK
jgi:hypothetical protein